MDRGTYVAASGGRAQLLKLQVTTNNLANVDTPGFKRQMVIGRKQEFEDTLASSINHLDPYAKADQERTPGVTSLETVTDFSPGPVQTTNSPLDAALREPNDFFVVNTPQGPRYTRAGNFTLDGSGNLVTQDGMQVIGDGGPITVSGAGTAAIQEDGSIKVGDATVGKLQVVRIEKPEHMIREGGNRFALGNGQAAPVTVDAQVVPNALEKSNVSAIGGMIDLIAVNKAFELYTKTSLTIDRMNQLSINEYGRRG